MGWGSLPTIVDSATQVRANVNVGLVAGNHNVRIVTEDGVSSNASVFAVNGVPTITQLTPATRTAGHALASLQITGSEFGAGMIARFDNTPLDSTVVNSTLITAVVPAGLLTAGTHQIAVHTADAVASNQLPFIVDPAPTLVSLDQNSRTAGNGPFTLTLTGTNFQADVQARFDNTGLATTRLNATTLTATVPAEVLAAGPHTIRVRSADGFDSNTLPFTVNVRQILTGISPNSRTATAAAFTMTLTGSNFVTGMVVNWQNGSSSTDLPAVFGSSTTLTASIPAPLILSAGTASLSVRSADLASSTALPFTILPAPVLTSINPPAVAAGSPNLSLVVNGANFVAGSVITFDGAAIGTQAVSPTSLSGLITAPHLASAGAHAVAVLTPDGVSSAPLLFAVVTPLQILSTGLPDGASQSPYSFVLAGIGGALPYAWNATGLPNGFTVTTAGLISGTPSGTGYFNVHVQLTDADGRTVTADLALTVEQSTGPLQFPPATLPQGVVGETYVGALTVTGGKPPYTVAVTNGALPPGITLSPTGFFSGKPTAPGRYTFSVRAGDTNSGTVTQSLFIDVIAPPLSITTASLLPELSIGGTAGISFGAQGGVPSYSFAAAGSLPPGTIFNNGTLSGSPTSAGTFSFRVTVTDSVGGTAGKDFSITVTAPELTITTSGLPPGQLNSSYSAQLSANGGTPPYTWTASGMPANISINSAARFPGFPHWKESFR